jgi:hypothetical protein
MTGWISDLASRMGWGVGGGTVIFNPQASPGFRGGGEQSFLIHRQALVSKQLYAILYETLTEAR